ncbi:hypothetical protein KDK95_18605 [Actinospica sp. MGRD01-02]|uniref:Lipoprotein n=1 Tax=Actinospica acidithermotolerans TaxID=2828514 RepID=A0A941IIG8_9ACTN|nr:hypothetical protein [Actinospica acidithermotolerans]MBR7828329.1 hypothetical protein [Actinospica acidithermotolerans]
MSQGIAPARPFRRRAAGAALAALTLPAVLALAGCDDMTAAAAPAAASATGAATDSAAEYSAVCSRVEAAWAEFLPNGSYEIVEKVTAKGKPYSVYKVDYTAYRRVSTGLFDSLTGNREYRLTIDIDSLAAAASDVYNDPGQSLSPKADLATLKAAAPVVAKDCGTTLEVPA